MITVYLDSSDYSRLSDPRTRSRTDAVRIKLLELAGRPDVAFVFSATHISEMAPLESQYTDSATARAEILVALCQRNALISFDKLIKAEVNRLNDRTSDPITPVTLDGTWFPDIGQIVSPVQWVDSFHQQTREMGLNRKTRRFLKSRTLKRGKPRREAIENMGRLDVGSLLELYPMRKEDAEILGLYVVGKASSEEADHAFLESLRDPSWMMRWFRDHHDKLGPVGEWVRGPSRKMSTTLHELSELGTKAFNLQDTTGPSSRNLFSSSGWMDFQDSMVSTIANRILLDTFPRAAPCVDAEMADKFCPGIATAIRVTHSSLRNSIGENARKPTQSDFVDAIHAMYAPYVTFFRSDRYMAPIISMHTEKYGTEVVSKLEELPERIEFALAAITG